MRSCKGLQPDGQLPGSRKTCILSHSDKNESSTNNDRKHAPSVNKTYGCRPKKINHRTHHSKRPTRITRIQCTGSKIESISGAHTRNNDLVVNCLPAKSTSDTEAALRRMAPISVASVHGYMAGKDLESLVETTGYNRKELFALFARFKALCKISSELTGSCDGIDKETFRKGILTLSVEDDLFVDRVFAVLDEDGSGTIEWEEFIIAMSALERGNNELKSRFLFKVYDVDKDGAISKKELLDFFLSSLMVKPDEVIMEVSNNFLSKIFSEVDVDGDGKINVEEAMKYIDETPEVKDIYEMFGRSMTEELLDGQPSTS